MIRVWLHNHRDTHTALAVGTITHRYNIIVYRHSFIITKSC